MLSRMVFLLEISWLWRHCEGTLKALWRTNFRGAHDSPPSDLDLEALSLEEESIWKHRKVFSIFQKLKEREQFEALEILEFCGHCIPWPVQFLKSPISFWGFGSDFCFRWLRALFFRVTLASAKIWWKKASVLVELWGSNLCFLTP